MRRSSNVSTDSDSCGNGAELYEWIAIAWLEDSRLCRRNNSITASAFSESSEVALRIDCAGSVRMQNECCNMKPTPDTRGRASNDRD
jgi:hypothetical protein